MEIVASISYEQYKAALSALQSVGRVRKRYSIGGIAAIIALGFAFAYLVQKSPHSAAITFIGLIATWVACLGMKQWSKTRYDNHLRELYQAQEKQLCGQLMTISQEGISGSYADQTYTYQYRWESFVGLIDLSDGLLFLPNTVSFVRIPKESLTGDEIQQIMRWWAPHAPKQARL